jgi:hypothetical protein
LLDLEFDISEKNPSTPTMQQEDQVVSNQSPSALLPVRLVESSKIMQGTENPEQGIGKSKAKNQLVKDYSGTRRSTRERVDSRKVRENKASM